VERSSGALCFFGAEATEGRRGTDDLALSLQQSGETDRGDFIDVAVGKRATVRQGGTVGKRVATGEQGFFTNGNRNLYRGYRSYRCGAVIKTAG
jgi:hypothetical protein